MRDLMPGAGLVNSGTSLRCPACGSRELRTFETLLGAVSCTVAIDKDGKRVVVHEGYTEVFWETSQSTGLLCASCCWEEEGSLQVGLEALRGSCAGCGSLVAVAGTAPRLCESCDA